MTGGRRSRTRFALALALVACAYTAAPATAASAARVRPPPLTASAAIVIDARTGHRLFSEHSTVRHAIASTTKLMTARLVLQRARQGEVFSAPAYHAGPGEVLIGLRDDERMTVHDLLRAMLLPSANDAAWDLAYNVGGSSVGHFVTLMNREARRLGLKNTHYENPIGLDNPRNYSTAGDLARLAMLDMRNRAFASIVRLTRARLRSGSRIRLVANRNDLVGRYPYVDGVKTGHTQQAGYVLVGAARRGGASVISVVLGEPNEARRDADSIALLRWGLRQYHRVVPLKRGHAVARLPIHWQGGRAAIAPARDFGVTVGVRTPVRVRLRTPSQVKGPLPAGATIGQADVLAGGAVVGTVPLVTVEGVPGASFVRRLSSILRGVLLGLGVLLCVLACTLVALRVRVVRRQRASSAR